MPDTAGDSSSTDRRAEEALIGSAARWMTDALDAWTIDDYSKVAVLAPLAVEHLGKAALWRENPVLLVPLSPDAESSLFSLATQPDLASPKLRTVGLAILLRRLEQLLGGLPIDSKQRTRMVEIRNGAMHVGSPSQSRHVLVDCLSVCGALLDCLGHEPKAYYGDHHSDVLGLLDEKRTEVGHRVAAKRARARRHLQELEARLGDAVFKETTDRLEELAPHVLEPEHYGSVQGHRLRPFVPSRRLRAFADRSASWSMYALRACRAICPRTAGSRTPSGSTCRSKRARNALVAGAVRPTRSAEFAQDACAAMRARRLRCWGVNGTAFTSFGQTRSPMRSRAWVIWERSAAALAP